MDLAAALEGPAADGGPSPEGIPAADPDTEPPLSFAQQRLWFLDRFEPGSTEYTTLSALRLRGPLDVDALGTRPGRPGGPARGAADHLRRAGRARAAGRAPAAPGRAAGGRPRRRAPGGPATRWLERVAATAFDLAAGPLLRARLVRLAEEEHVLVLAVHHIVTDGWSMGVLGRELGALYAAAHQRRRPALPDCPSSTPTTPPGSGPALTGPRRTSLLARELLDGLVPLDLPTDRPRPAVRTREGALVTFTLPAGLTGRLRERGQEAGATLFMTVLAACQILLARWAGQQDVARRHRRLGPGRSPSSNDVVGMFVNTLVLRGRVRPELTFRELLAESRATVLAAYAHQEVPFERLVDALAARSATPAARRCSR